MHNELNLNGCDQQSASCRHLWENLENNLRTRLQVRQPGCQPQQYRLDDTATLYSDQKNTIFCCLRCIVTPPEEKITSEFRNRK